MRFGTIIRLFITLCIIICPIIVTNVCDDVGLKALYTLYIAIPLMIFWEVMCSDKLCSDCAMSGYCDKKQKLKNTKKIFLFIGYPKEWLNQIKESDLINCGNSYYDISKYIINKFNEESGED